MKADGTPSPSAQIAAASLDLATLNALELAVRDVIATTFIEAARAGRTIYEPATIESISAQCARKLRPATADEMLRVNQAGRETGRKEGEAAGYLRGFDEGYDQGLVQGRRETLLQGRE